MNVETLAERLMFSTIRLEGTGPLGGRVGTGFIYQVEDSKGSIPFLVTNRHVAEQMSAEVKATFVLATNGKPDYGSSTTIPLDPAGWTFHPVAEVDVAVRPIGAVIERLAQRGTPSFFVSISTGLAMTADEYEMVDAIEDVIFIGYPDGLYDTHNHTSIVRTGTTASPIALDFGGTPQFLIDASVFGGSSGSPVFILDRGGTYRVRSGAAQVGGRIILLGVVAAVWERTNFFPLMQPATAPGVQVPQSLHLGVVFKASAIDDICDAILEANGTARRFPRGTDSSSTPVDAASQG